MTGWKDFWRKRKLIRAIRAIEWERDKALAIAHSVEEGMEILVSSGKKIEPLKEEIDRLTTKDLVKKATKLGIEIPRERWHYVENPEFPSFAPLDWYLQGDGQRTVTSFCTKERRGNIEWWVKVLVPILSLIVGILWANRNRVNCLDSVAKGNDCATEIG
jgi:hypothetical protein